MRTRRASVELSYNGAAVTSKMADYKTEVTYTDPASGEADGLDIALQDRLRQWTVAWLPITGDTLEATIKVTDRGREGDNRTLACGFFILVYFDFAGCWLQALFQGYPYRRMVRFGPPSGPRHGRASRFGRSARR